jgi:hypothetical protein
MLFWLVTFLFNVDRIVLEKIQFFFVQHRTCDTNFSAVLYIIFDKWGGGGWWGMDWIDMAQDRDRWRALVSAIMNLRVP